MGEELQVWKKLAEFKIQPPGLEINERTNGSFLGVTAWRDFGI